MHRVRANHLPPTPNPPQTPRLTAPPVHPCAAGAQFNQPPTNDTFLRAARFDNFTLHLASPWERLEVEGDQVGEG